MTASRRSPSPSPQPGRRGDAAGAARSYGLMFLVVLLVLGLGLFGVLSICRSSLEQDGVRRARTAQGEAASQPASAGFPPPIPPTAVATPYPWAAASPSPSPGPGGGSGNERVHVVQSGDTLYGIANRYSVTLEALLRANGLTPTSVLQIGQRLNLP